MERGSFVVFGAVMAVQAGDAEGQVQGLAAVEPGIAFRFVAVAQIALGDVVAAADALVPSSPATSMWMPPGCVPSGRCTSKKPTTSSSTSSNYLVL